MTEPVCRRYPPVDADRLQDEDDRPNLGQLTQWQLDRILGLPKGIVGRMFCFVMKLVKPFRAGLKAQSAPFLVPRGEEGIPSDRAQALPTPRKSRRCISALQRVLSTGFLSVLALTAVVNPAHVDAHEPSDDELPDYRSIGSPDVAVFESYVYFVAQIDNDIHLRASVDNGATFMAASTDMGASLITEWDISNNPETASEFPRVAACSITHVDPPPEVITAGSRACVTWRETHAFGFSPADVVFAVVEFASCESDPDKLCVSVFTSEIVKVSDDGSCELGSAVSAYDSSTCYFDPDDGGPDLIVEGDTVHVVWSACYDLSYTQSRDGGTSFGPIVAIPDASATFEGNTLAGRLAAVAGHVYYSWPQSGGFTLPDLEYGKVPDYYQSTVVSQNEAGHSAEQVSVGTGDGIPGVDHQLTLAWTDTMVFGEDPIDPEVFVRRYLFAGEGSSATPVESLGVGQSPAVATTNTAVHVAWQDGDFEISLRTAPAGVSSFGDPIVLYAAGTNELPEAAGYGSALHVVWHHEPSPFILWSSSILSTGCSGVLYKRSSDEGQTFSSATFVFVEWCSPSTIEVDNFFGQIAAGECPRQFAELCHLDLDRLIKIEELLDPIDWNRICPKCPILRRQVSNSLETSSALIRVGLKSFEDGWRVLSEIETGLDQLRSLARLSLPSEGQQHAIRDFLDEYRSLLDRDLDHVLNQHEDPYPRAGEDSRVGIGLSITFDASASFDAVGRITAYEWDFDDGTSSLGKVVSHSYDTPGTYHVRLTVVDEEGTIATDVVEIVVTSPLLDYLPWLVLVVLVTIAVGGVVWALRKRKAGK